MLSCNVKVVANFERYRAYFTVFTDIVQYQPFFVKSFRFLLCKYSTVFTVQKPKTFDGKGLMLSAEKNRPFLTCD